MNDATCLTANSSSPAPAAVKMRCIVYVDSFNWYFGIFQHRPAWKWLNIQAFFERVRPHEDVIAVNFFTAIVDPKRNQSERRDRQKRYLKALGTLSKVKIILGSYQEREVTCRAVECGRRLKYLTPEEKKTDVNIAIQMIDDARQDKADSMILVSSDSDFEPAVKWVRKNFPKIKILVYIPVLPDEEKQRRIDAYVGMGVTCRQLPIGDIPASVFPETISVSEAETVTRPVQWTA